LIWTPQRSIADAFAELIFVSTGQMRGDENVRIVQLNRSPVFCLLCYLQKPTKYPNEKVKNKA
jgi:hypothetical protein